MIEKHHLLILDAVKREGSLTAAAESLHLTQPALTHAIKKLEQQAGTALWQKQGRTLQLTPAGRYLQQVAARLLPQFSRAEDTLQLMARGEQGVLRIGMECHPCYQWLLKVVAPFLAEWPQVDVDVKQRFQFGGVQALFDHDIDLLVTPDPLQQEGLAFTPVFDYEQVLVVAAAHPLANKTFARPTDLRNETLITYPVAIDRLDIYSQFLQPADIFPRKHKTIETTDILLQMVAAGRGVSALPHWLVTEYQARMALAAVRLGEDGLPKQIYLGRRTSEPPPAYLDAFLGLARSQNH